MVAFINQAVNKKILEKILPVFSPLLLRGCYCEILILYFKIKYPFQFVQEEMLPGR